MKKLKTPCYVYRQERLINNLKKFKEISLITGIEFNFSLKGFSYAPALKIIGEWFIGASCSSLNEVLLAKNFFKKVDVYNPAYENSEVDDIIFESDAIVFNSFRQLLDNYEEAIAQDKTIGIRINPKTKSHSIEEAFNPVSSKSRFGIDIDKLNIGMDGTNINEMIREGVIKYIHFHTLNGASVKDLVEVLEVVAEKMDAQLKDIDTLNIGGGVLWTESDIDISLLAETVLKIRERFPNLKIIAEPCESVVNNVGDLVTKVIDIVSNDDGQVAIINTSMQNNLLDIIQYPHIPIEIVAKSKETNKGSYSYYIGGNSCLTGDMTDTKRMFDNELQVGDTIIFKNVASYSKVQSNNFNGLKKPSCYFVYKDKILEQSHDTYHKFISTLI